MARKTLLEYDIVLREKEGLERKLAEYRDLEE